MCWLISIAPTWPGTERHQLIWSDLPQLENFAHFVASVDASKSKSRETQKEEKVPRTHPKHFSSCGLRRKKTRGGGEKRLKSRASRVTTMSACRSREPIRSGESCPHFSLHCRMWAARLRVEQALQRIIIEVRCRGLSSRGVSVFESGIMSKLVGPTAEAVPRRYLHPAVACVPQPQPHCAIFWHTLWTQRHNFILDAASQCSTQPVRGSMAVVWTPDLCV